MCQLGIVLWTTFSQKVLVTIFKAQIKHRYEKEALTFHLFSYYSYADNYCIYAGKLMLILLEGCTEHK